MGSHLLSRGSPCACADQREDTQCSAIRAGSCHFPHLWGQRRPRISPAPCSPSLALCQSSVYVRVCTPRQYKYCSLSAEQTFSSCPLEKNLFYTSKKVHTDSISNKTLPEVSKWWRASQRANPALWRAKSALSHTAGNPVLVWVNTTANEFEVSSLGHAGCNDTTNQMKFLL